jgi:hypothetical protein
MDLFPFADWVDVMRFRRRVQRLMRDCEQASFPVFEAVLVAIIIFAAMLFLTSLQRPTQDHESLGVDLGRGAQDMLDILEQKNFTVGGQVLGFEQWMNKTLQGDAATKDEVHAFIKEVLKGNRYALRLDNGVEPMHLLPPGNPPAPRAGRGATTFFLPNWTDFAGQVYLRNATPGQPMGFNPCDGGADDFTSLKAPNNATNGPTGTPWAGWWCANAPKNDAGVAQTDRAPLTAMPGPWRYVDGGSCSAGCHMMVRTPNGASPQHPIYGLQLVVWTAA